MGLPVPKNIDVIRAEVKQGDLLTNNDYVAVVLTTLSYENKHNCYLISFIDTVVRQSDIKKACNEHSISQNLAHEWLGQPDIAAAVQILRGIYQQRGGVIK